MVYCIPSSPLPPQSFSAAPESTDDEMSIAGLAKRVSAYLARVVGALADFEDRLLTEDGFFAREEHFEAQIDSLRREFEGNRRATVRLRRRPIPALGLSTARLLLFRAGCVIARAGATRRSSSAPTPSTCSSLSSLRVRARAPTPSCIRAASSSSSSPRPCCSRRRPFSTPYASNRRCSIVCGAS